ncbi:hypothetical protein [Streptosporangium sp. H16]|uniref:hypothetical protein n=1 Tax=Streptosporangium sp. H16 TaxID=3444184 RepID=UPI003F7A90C0
MTDATRGDVTSAAKAEDEAPTGAGRQSLVMLGLATLGFAVNFWARGSRNC